MEWALIKNGIVENIIVADEQFIDFIRSKYHHCVRIDRLEQKPHIGWIYDGKTFKPAE